MMEGRHLLLDLGVYAAVLAGIAALFTFVANPTRAMNRYFSLFMLTMGVWQVVVAMARTTRDYNYWGPRASLFGGLMLGLMALFYDATIFPHSAVIPRLKRLGPIVLAGIAFILGSLLAYSRSAAGAFPLYPLYLHLLCLALMSLSVYYAYQQRVRAPRVNRHEMSLFVGTFSVVMFLFTVFMLMRSPLGSRIMSAAVVVYLCWVLILIFSDQVLDAKGAGGLAFWHLIAISAHVAFTWGAAVVLQQAIGPITAANLWQAAVCLAVLNYALALLTSKILHHIIHSARVKAVAAVREESLKASFAAENEVQLTHDMAQLAKDLVAAEKVVIAISGAPISAEQRHLAAAMKTDWLTPESALRQFRGKALQDVIAGLEQVNMAAIVRGSGQYISVHIFVYGKEANALTVNGAKISLLREIASIAASGIERIRAIEASLRARSLAVVGRLAAQYNHEARNQMAAITALLEALRDGEDASLSPAYREAVYQQALALSANHNLALEVTRLRPERVSITSCSIAKAARDTLLLCSKLIAKNRVHVVSSIGDGLPSVAADERFLRQILLNLVQNSVEAMSATSDPAIHLSARVGPATLWIDIEDNGPGIPASIYDQLFCPWITTKVDGTGLGLSFCQQAVALMGGTISCTPPRAGTTGACFTLGLPLQISVVAPGA